MTQVNKVQFTLFINSGNTELVSYIRIIQSLFVLLHDFIRRMFERPCVHSTLLLPILFITLSLVVNSHHTVICCFRITLTHVVRSQHTVTRTFASSWHFNFWTIPVD